MTPEQRTLARERVDGECSHQNVKRRDDWLHCPDCNASFGRISDLSLLVAAMEELEALSVSNGHEEQPDTRAPLRRVRLDLFTPAERAIYAAQGVVENLPADRRLTEASILLDRARGLVADYVEGRPWREPV